jgi:site-specific recombinase XerD
MTIQASGVTHAKYLPEWEKAMQYGLMTGRPFSKDCVKIYSRYVFLFLAQYETVSVEHLRHILTTIPVEQFSKRLKIHQAICSFSKYLIEQGELPESFITHIQKIKPKRHLPPKKISVSEPDIEKLLAVCRTPLDRMIVELLSQTGLRASEATHLLLDDIDLERGYLIVRRAKWGKTRKVGLNLRVQQALRNYLAQRSITESQYLLNNGSGQPISRHGVFTRLEKLGHLADIEVTPHALRRAFVTINANKGRPLQMLQMACGHSDITTTRSYCLTTEDETIEAMKSWE